MVDVLVLTPHPFFSLSSSLHNSPVAAGLSERPMSASILDLLLAAPKRPRMYPIDDAEKLVTATRDDVPRNPDQWVEDEAAAEALFMEADEVKEYDPAEADDLERRANALCTSVAESKSICCSINTHCSFNETSTNT